MNRLLRDVAYERVAPWLVAACAIVAHLVALATPSLLEEQFIIAWAKSIRSAGALLAFLHWSGPQPVDLWGPVTTLVVKITQLIGFSSIFLFRVEGLLLHAAAAALAFLILRRLWDGPLLPFVGALLFALYPLNAEAVSWLGGRGIELATAFLLGSFYCYLRGRGVTTRGAHVAEADSGSPGCAFATLFDWRWLLISLVLFLSALLSSALVWTSVFMFAALEMSFAFAPGSDKRRSDPTIMVLGPLAMFVTASAYVAASGLYRELTSWEAGPFLTATVIRKTLGIVFFPINKPVWHGYKTQFIILYVLYAPILVAWLWSLWLNPRLRLFCGLMLVWFVLAVTPSFGHVAIHENLFGCRTFYPCALPLSALLAAAISSTWIVLDKYGSFRWGMIVSSVLTAAFAVFFLAHSWNENMVYRNGGRLLSHVQKSLAVIESKTNAPYLLMHDVPAHIAAMPGWTINRVVAFDGRNRLLSAANTSAGRLKDALRQGQFRDICANWQADLMSFVPLQVGAVISNFPSKLDAAGVANRFLPPIGFYKTAQLDTSRNELLLTSNNPARGPAFTFMPDGISPFDTDFLQIDAKIDAPSSAHKPEIEMYWETRQKAGYDSKERRTATSAVLNDGQFHSYLLPLRTVGWFANGDPVAVTIGFPAGATVALTGMQLVGKEKVMPAFDVVLPPSAGARLRFDPPFYSYPTFSDLGLFHLDKGADKLTVTYSSTNIATAAGVIVEISRPNMNFPNPCGNEFSGVGFKSIPIEGNKGTYAISLSDLPRTGIYSVRAIAMDVHHRPVGNFSDAVYCFVHRPVRTGWAEQ